MSSQNDEPTARPGGEAMSVIFLVTSLALSLMYASGQLEHTLRFLRMLLDA